MSGDVKVEVHGLTQGVRRLRKIDHDASRDVKNTIREAAKLVQARARAVAGEKGLAAPGLSGRGTGALMKGIRVFATDKSAGVRNDVTRGGYPYPSEYEFGHGAARAFVTPAGEESRDKVRSMLEGTLARLAN